VRIVGFGIGLMGVMVVLCVGVIDICEDLSFRFHVSVSI